jgi:hypothetical protein
MYKTKSHFLFAFLCFTLFLAIALHIVIVILRLVWKKSHLELPFQVAQPPCVVCPQLFHLGGQLVLPTALVLLGLCGSLALMLQLAAQPLALVHLRR